MADHFSMKQENSEMEDMSARHVEIKKEPQEFKDLIESRNLDLGNDDFKEEISDPENKIDKNENLDIEEDKPLRKKRHKKKSRKVLNQSFPEPPAGLVENYYDLDLSVEFLSQLFKYVDELCEYINNGDQNGNRSSVVIQNLNYAVSCYRVNLPNPDEVIKGQLISEANFKVFI